MQSSFIAKTESALIYTHKRGSVLTEEFFSFENIINTMGFGICVYDAYGFIRYYNPAFSNAYLEGSDKYKGRHFSDIRNREYRQLTCMPRMMKEREKIFIQKQLENYGSFFIDCSPSFDENGSLKYIVETIASAFKAPILPLKTFGEYISQQFSDKII